MYKYSFIVQRGVGLKDKKAAKLIIKRAKEHPEMYTKEEVRFAKMVKKRIKQEKKAKQNDC